LPRIDDFQNALSLARAKLRSLDPAETCRNAGAQWLPLAEDNKIILPVFLRNIVVTHPDGMIGYEEGENNISLQEQGLILHYLLGVKDMPLTGEWITFREIPSGEFYYQPFLKRAQVPLVATFGSNHESFRNAGVQLGGRDAKMGDTSMTFLPFPKVPVTVMLWKGDEEFSPDGNILFNSSIKHFLSGEDIAVLAGIVIYKLMALSKLV
jgi:hypothetical protein